MFLIYKRDTCLVTSKYNGAGLLYSSFVINPAERLEVLCKFIVTGVMEAKPDLLHITGKDSLRVTLHSVTMSLSLESCCKNLVAFISNMTKR